MSIVPEGYVFSKKEFLEEIETIYWERESFLKGKIATHKIGEVEANLARYRLERLKALGAFFRKLYETEKAEKTAARDGERRREPEQERPPPAPEPERELEPVAATEAREFTDDEW